MGGVEAESSHEPHCPPETARALESPHPQETSPQEADYTHTPSKGSTSSSSSPTHAKKSSSSEKAMAHRDGRGGPRGGDAGKKQSHKRTRADHDVTEYGRWGGRLRTVLRESTDPAEGVWKAIHITGPDTEPPPSDSCPGHPSMRPRRGVGSAACTGPDSEASTRAQTRSKSEAMTVVCPFKY